ncbi:MAG: LysR family transcriptional regulator [Oribacterium sp.]|nr:LysR family transcriptional regulator [Oribacterium sp.]
MNTKQLRYLITINQCGNLSTAARSLGISQPALSKQLSEWERIYGICLFKKENRRLLPTEQGSVFLEKAQRILDEQNRTILSMKTVAGAARQRIRLCTAPNRGAIIYSEVYQRFSRRYPDISLDLIERFASEQPEVIKRGIADIALGAGNISSSVEDIPFAKQELLIALPSSHPLSTRKEVTLSELRDTPFVLQGERHSVRGIADKLFQKAGFDPLVVFESDDVILIDALIRQSMGAGLVSRIHVKPCEEVRYISLDPPVYQLTHLRYPKGHILTESERYLAGLLIQHRLSDPGNEPIDSLELKGFLKTVEEIEKSAPVGPSRLEKDEKNRKKKRSEDIHLDTRILEYIVAIADEKGLTQAAERFLLAQPALSRHVRNVEDMLGIPLFTREHNRLLPTNAGKVFINGARNILKLEEDMFTASKYN